MVRLCVGDHKNLRKKWCSFGKQLFKLSSSLTELPHIHVLIKLGSEKTSVWPESEFFFFFFFFFFFHTIFQTFL